MLVGDLEPPMGRKMDKILVDLMAVLMAAH